MEGIKDKIELTKGDKVLLLRILQRGEMHAEELRELAKRFRKYGTGDVYRAINMLFGGEELANVYAKLNGDERRALQLVIGVIPEIEKLPVAACKEQ